jgi:hypothetical protein
MDDVTCFCHRVHNRTVILMSPQNVFSRGRSRTTLLVALLVGRVFAKVLVDLVVFREEMGEKRVGKIDVRNVRTHSGEMGLLVERQQWPGKRRQESQWLGVGGDVVVADDIAELALDLSGRRPVRKEKGQRLQGIDCCTVFHLVS